MTQYGDNLPGWAVVITKSMSEHIAAKSLRQAGYREYLPVYRKITWPHGKGRASAATMVPLITGHLFVQDWRGTQTPIMGMAGLMRFGGELATLCDEDIAILWGREKKGEFDEHRPGDKRATRFNIGDEVETEQAGARIAGIYRGLSPKGQAIIGTALGLTVKVDVDRLQLAMA